MIWITLATGMNGCDCEEQPDGTVTCELDCDYWDCDSYDKSVGGGSGPAAPLFDGVWQVSFHRLRSDCRDLPGEPGWSDAVLTQSGSVSLNRPASLAARITRPSFDLEGTLIGEVRLNADGSHTLELAGSRTLPGACPMRVEARLRGAAGSDGALGRIELLYVPLGGGACPARRCSTQGRFEMFQRP